jgi:hypothetical protein
MQLEDAKALYRPPQCSGGHQAALDLVMRAVPTGCGGGSTSAPSLMSDAKGLLAATQVLINSDSAAQDVKRQGHAGE